MNGVLCYLTQNCYSGKIHEKTSYKQGTIFATMRLSKIWSQIFGTQIRNPDLDNECNYRNLEFF